MAHTGAQLSGSGAQLSGSGAQLSGSGAQLSAISAYLHTSYLGAQLSASPIYYADSSAPRGFSRYMALGAPNINFWT